MPVTPPLAIAIERFDPKYLTDDDLDDLASFTGLSRDACLDRVRSYSMAELAKSWREAGPRSPEEMLEFYRSTDLYIWEQMQWHASPDRGLYWRALQQLVSQFPPDAGYRRVFEFGAGIGTDALYLASEGYEVTLVDVEGPAFRFAKHRFERRGITARFVESHSPLPAPDATYDVVVSFDVFEHLPDPLEAARRLVGSLRPGGVLVQMGGFIDDGHHPCHLEDGVHQFGGEKWGIHLAGLGLRGVGSNVLVNVRGPVRVTQQLRFWVWRATGLWVTRVPQ